MPNLWEELTKRREIPSNIHIPSGLREVIDGERDQKKLLTIAVAMGLIASGHAGEALSSREISNIIEAGAKKITW